MKEPSLRLFHNPLLERLTHVQVETVAVLWSLVIGGLWGWSVADARFQALPALWFAAVGALAWTLFEYSLHRWVFHWRPRGPLLRRLVFMIHGIHHAQPDDPSRVVMPPLVSLPLAVLLWGLAGVMLDAPWRDAFFAGFLMGYLHYDVTHWACHQTKPRTRWGKLVRRHHLRHHHADEHSNFGVGTPLWDHLFGSVLGHRERRT